MKRKQLTCALWAKALAFALTVVFTLAVAGCALGAVGMAEGEFYTRGPEQIRQAALESLANDAAWDAFQNPEQLALHCQGTNQSVDLYGIDGAWRGGSGAEQPALETDDDGVLQLPEEAGRDVFWFLFGRSENGVTNSGRVSGAQQLQAQIQELQDWAQLTAGGRAMPTDLEPGPERAPSAADEPDGTVGPELTLIAVHLKPGLPEHDLYRLMSGVAGFAYAMRYGVYVLGAVSLVLAVICFVFLMCAAGRRAGEEQVTPRGLSRVPFDLFTAAVGLLVILGAALLDELWGSDMAMALGLVVYVLAAVCIGLGWCVSTAVRFKAGTWWRNTVIFRVLRLLWRAVRAVGQWLGRFFRALPLVKRTVLVLAGVTAADLVLLVLCASVGSWGALIVLWIVEKLVMLPAAVLLAVELRRLQAGALALSEGDLSHQIDLTHLHGSLKEHGERLNRIAAGMSRAVDARMKSERMKTELITNVSHDIKTPLTSIINYTDLIARQPTENEQTREYAEVLLRQSERLKKLLEDLVEASRAASGSVEVLLAPCEVGVLLGQALGEYEARLAALQLEPVLTQPEEPVRILADGRRMWRVFDNLLGNICKYAQPGTRVYLDVTRAGGEVVIAFKNTSRDRLNITADELMERFVRGDASRASEGSGLGLSIARSLVQLQGGSLALVIDGDLFKAELRFREAM